MSVDKNKIEEVTMALLWLTMFEDGIQTRAWKGLDWDVMHALHERGWISDPKSKAKSVVVLPEGKVAAQELFRKYFEKTD
jgi:hypothetical protein